MNPITPNVYSTEQINSPVPVVQGGYPQPVVGVAQPVIVNQLTPVIMLPAHTSSSYTTVCPHCKNMVSTTAIKQFNCCTCCLCYLTGCIWFLIIQAVRGKDFCCYDATHNCPACGLTISTYQSC